MNRQNTIKFFIVFNDTFSRLLYHQYLVKIGFKNNILIENAEDCISKLDLEPDVIFMDCGMAPLSGLEALKVIKETYPDIHVLLLECPNKKHVMQQAMDHGATAIIPKGDHDLDMLRDAVENIVATKVKPRKRQMAQYPILLPNS